VVARAQRIAIAVLAIPHVVDAALIWPAVLGVVALKVVEARFRRRTTGPSDRRRLGT